MKKFLLLTKVLIKSGIGNGLVEGKKSKLFLYVILGICMIPAVAMFGYIGYMGYEMFEGINTGIVIGLALYAGVFLSFFTGMTMCIGVFFSSSDTEFLLPLPLKAEVIVGAKFCNMYVYALITNIILLLPFFVGYGLSGGLEAPYWIIMIIITALIPVTPLVYGSLFAMVLIRVFKKARNKDVLTVVVTLFSFVLVIGINTLTNSMDSMSQNEVMSMIINKGNSIVDVVSKVFPNTVLAENAIANESILMMLAFIGSLVAFIGIFLLVAKAVYFTSVVEMSSTTSKSKSMSGEEIKKAGRSNSQVKSYVKKEIKLVTRTPIYFLNCMLMSIAWPIIILIPAAMSIISENGSSEESAVEGMNLVNSINSSEIGQLCVLVVFGLTVLAVAFSMTNTTCISREGKNVFFMKYIPMSYEKQLRAKLLPGIILTIITGTGYSIVAMIASRLIFGLEIPVVYMIAAVIISILTAILFNMVEIISDIIKPKLQWQSEQAAVKQNFIAIIPMFLIMVIGIGLIVGAIFLRTKIGVDHKILIAGVIVMLAGLCVGCYKLDVILANKHFPKY